ncbi:hypothetical protein [Pedobacter sp. SYP-B3415]|uniref:hypothetical protein n=1 Tax=Pedobacter sp. SYP-B3415 TaxID=2496641 RepID=UPI00101D6135|nr:hypothetical protein [Pedobacter sp. SYP-B3415]
MSTEHQRKLSEKDQDCTGPSAQHGDAGRRGPGRRDPDTAPTPGNGAAAQHFRGSGYSTYGEDDAEERTDKPVSGKPGSGKIVTPRNQGPSTRP